MKHLAFLIGAQRYQHVPSLRTPLNDIRSVGEVLQTRYNYSVTFCEDPALRDMKLYLKRMARQIKGLDDPEAVFVLLYFAGHGVALDSETGICGYLIPCDGSRDERESWLSMEWLSKFLQKLPCRHILLMLDCCFSGSLRWAAKYRSAMAIGTQDRLYQQHYWHFMNRRSCQVLTSAAPNQLALDFTRGGTITKRSPFAECIIAGLNGDADAVPDRVITGAELYAYLQSRLLVISKKGGNAQNAGFFPLERHDFGEYMFFMSGFKPEKLQVREYANPYRGLSTYEQENSQDFFGRSKAIDSLLREVARQPLTIVLGASGTGKSSLVKAGILPRLLEETGNRVQVIKPGLIPLAELPDPIVYNILVVDQLEQLITQAPEKQALLFLEQILKLLKAGKKIIAILRIDYEKRLPVVKELEPYWCRYLVPPFNAEELREVIVTPCYRQGHFIVPITLVDRIIEEVIHYPGALPLLSFTMQQLFEHCKDAPFRNITPADYEDLGGVIGALQKKADAVYDELPDTAHRTTMKCLILRMVSLKGGHVAGKRVLFEDLDFYDSLENNRVKTVLEHLEQARLIVADSDHSGQAFIEPVHDALVNTWGKVQQWIKTTGQANLLLISELESAAQKYRRENEQERYLWHNSASLTQVTATLLPDRTRFLLNRKEQDFLSRSLRRRQRNTIILRTVITLVILSLSGLSIWALKSRNDKQKQYQKNYAESIAYKSLDALRNGDRSQAFQLAKLAYRYVDPENIMVFNAIADCYYYNDSPDSLQRACWNFTFDGSHTSDISGLAFSPSGKYLASSSKDSTVIIWNILTGSVRDTIDFAPFNLPQGLTFSPDEKYLAIGAENEVMLYELESKSKLTLIPGPIGNDPDDVNTFNHLAFSSNGKYLAAGGWKQCCVWDIPGGTQNQRFRIPPIGFRPLSFSEDHNCWALLNRASDDIYFISPDKINPTEWVKAKPWDQVKSPKVMKRDTSLVVHLPARNDIYRNLSEASDLKTFALATDEEEYITLWDSKNGLFARPIHDFSKDWRFIAAQVSDSILIVWDTRQSGVTTALRMSEGEISRATFSEDGSLLAVAAKTGFLKIFETSNWRPVYTFPGRGHNISAIAFSKNNQYIAIGSDGNLIRIWNLRADKVATDYVPQPDKTEFISYGISERDNYKVIFPTLDPFMSFIGGYSGSDGMFYASVYSYGKTEIMRVTWNKEKTVVPNEVSRLIGHTNFISCSSFSPTIDHLVATGSLDQTVKIWDASSGQNIITFKGHTAPITGIFFSEDGKYAASISSDKKCLKWPVSPEIMIRDINSRYNMLAPIQQNDILQSGLMELFEIHPRNEERFCRQETPWQIVYFAEAFASRARQAQDLGLSNPNYARAERLFKCALKKSGNDILIRKRYLEFLGEPARQKKN